MSESADHDYILHHVRELGVKLIRLWFADVAGRLKEVAITSEQLESVLEDGLGVDGGVMGGPSQDESELILVPDASTFALLPPLDGVSEVGRMFCDVRTPAGDAAPDDTRAVLKAALARASARGYTFYAGCEIEHFYFRQGDGPLTPMDQGRRYDPGLPNELMSLKRDTLLALEQLGVAVDSFHHEDAPGQYKVGLQYNDALSMADGLVTYRQVARQVARRFGIVASFMPKPLTEHEGSGLHFSLSLTRGEENAFYGADDATGLSGLARGFLAGLLDHAPAITLVTNPTVNSYKRLAPGFSAPVACTWAPSGRGDLVRIPALQTGHGPRSTRLEYRVADPSCNPYLALTALLEAGLDGAERALEPPPSRASDVAPEHAGVPLPRSLAEAIGRSRESELLTRALGDALHDELIRAAQQQWDEYHTHVSAWEIASYLEL
ncbi:MAG: glutamine synthetase [Deltaproteobacteria bacterium]|nr:glutamine synthetase [Deltaproteobacteria bacterium]MCB9787876.1 glutamine synthetase [Deltaproteobacteria bacterium]